MPIQRKQTSNLRQVFSYLLILTAFFIFFEISFFIQTNKAYFSDFTEVSHHIDLPMAAMPGILYLIFAQSLLHFTYCLFISVLTLLISYLFQAPNDKMVNMGIVIWLLGMMTVLIANQVYFPNSKFASLTEFVLSQNNAHYLLMILLLIMAAVLFFSMLGVIKIARHSSRLWFVPLSIGIVGVVIYSVMPTKSVIRSISSTEKPNIIIVGVDALRPDFLSYFGRASNTPFFNDFLNHATVFSDSLTPAARTFPSWISILTGDYPKQTGARFNLANPNALHLKDTLSAMLQQKGYETVYASDETRFSNIEKSMGFDHILSPPIGLNDFLLSTFNDFPLSNLIVNTSLGKWLFPYSYGNRSAYFTYQPDSFLNLIQPSLSQLKKKPLFLAIHFTLPHWPYIWADLSEESTNILERYQAAIVRTDKQVSDFFSMLKAQGFLDHAIVVLLSDHGEAMELVGDRITEQELFVGGGNLPRFYPPSLDDEEVNQSAGHGTDVLGLTQYHNLLAFKLFGLGPQKIGAVSDLVTLLDVKPTILNLMHLPTHTPSLAGVIKNQQANAPLHEDVFLESDYTPTSMRTVYPEMKKVALEGINLYQVNPKSLRVTFKEKAGQMTIQSKQFADVHGEWMLAFYPQSTQHYIPILINLKTGEWTNHLDSRFAKQSPAKQILINMKQFYGQDLANASIYSN